MAPGTPGKGDPGRLLGRAFAGLALFAAAALGVGLAFIPEAHERVERLALWSGIGAALLFAIAVSWLLLRHWLVRPLEAMGRDLELVAHAQSGAVAERPALADLGALSDGARLLIERFAALRRETGDAVAAAAAGLEEQKR